MAVERLQKILTDLLSLSKETEWVEFKENNEDPREIGEYISALANSAALLGEKTAWIIWGIENESHRVTGTSFKPRQKKVGNEEMENWLHHLLSPRLNFRIHEMKFEGESSVNARL